MSPNELKEIFGEPIYVYGDNQAIEDGVLVEPFPEQFPGWLLTAGVHDAIVAKIEGTARSYPQAVIPLLMDARMIVKSHPDDLYTRGLEGNVTGQAIWIGANERAFTLMFPSER